MRICKSAIVLTLLASTLLAGCGGGGGGGSSNAGPVVSTLSFQLLSAQNLLNKNGLTKNFTTSITTVSGATVVGPCNGSGSVTTAPATTPATFEGNNLALSAVSTVTITIPSSPGCPAVGPTVQTTTDFFDSNFVPLGSSAVGDYSVFRTPLLIPTSVKVGDTGTIGTEDSFVDITKAVRQGTTAISYAIEADTSTTAIVNLISRVSDTAGNLTSTEQDRFRITSVGALTPISAEVQFTNGSRATLTYI